MKTGVNATKLAIGAFVVPYIFCMNPAMLLIDASALQIVMIVVTSLLGIFGVAAALNGHLFRSIAWPLRVVLAVAGLLMLDPTVTTDLVGIALLALCVLWQRFGKAQKTAA